jgi:hypothetical protein
MALARQGAEQIYEWLSGMSARGVVTAVFVIQLASMAQAQGQPAQPPPETAEENWLGRGELTGDWGGARVRHSSRRRAQRSRSV